MTFTTQEVNAFALSFADALVSAKSKAEVQASNDALFKGSEVKPTMISAAVGDLFKHTDRPFKDVTKQMPVAQWPLLPASICEIDEDYFFRLNLLQDILIFIQEPTEFGLWLSGEKGTGKTSVLEQITARLGRKLYQETGSAKTEYFDLFGMHVPIGNGKTRFMAGGLLLAMREGGVFVLNEADAMLPSEQIKLNEIISGKACYVPQLEEWIYPHKDFRFAATGNTNGSGDDSGNYLGTNRMNSAFMDRFMSVVVEYLPKEVEVELLKLVLNKFVKQKGLDKNPHFNLKTYEAFCDEMVEVATLVRQAVKSQSGASSVLSIRGLKRWLLLVVQNTKMDGMNTLKAAFMKAYGNSLTEVERITALELCVDVFGDQFNTAS